MKKCILFLLVLVFSLVNINLNLVSAAGPYNEFTSGCTSTIGYSTTTGEKCNMVVSTSLPAGCSSTQGYSPLTGVKCDTSFNLALPSGCTSITGYSPTTGVKCDSVGQKFPDGCNSYSGFSYTNGLRCDSSYIIVTNPYLGEIWTRGTIKTISWSDPNYISTHEIHLISVGSLYVIANNIQGSSFNWTVGDYLSGAVPDGVYTIKVCQGSADTPCGSSSSTITIGR